MNWSYVCRGCRSEYTESGKGLSNNHHLQNGINPSGLPLKLCGACGNVVDLCPAKHAGGRGYAPASQRVLNNKRTRRTTDTDTESAEEVAE